jgi:hypothetical protein
VPTRGPRLAPFSGRSSEPDGANLRHQNIPQLRPGTGDHHQAFERGSKNILRNRQSIKPRGTESDSSWSGRRTLASQTMFNFFESPHCIITESFPVSEVAEGTVRHLEVRLSLSGRSLTFHTQATKAQRLQKTVYEKEVPDHSGRPS